MGQQEASGLANTALNEFFMESTAPTLSHSQDRRMREWLTAYTNTLLNLEPDPRAVPPRAATEIHCQCGAVFTVQRGALT